MVVMVSPRGVPDSVSMTFGKGDSQRSHELLMSGVAKPWQMG